MDVEPAKLGKALSRDIASRSPEAADAEIERFISKRSVALALDPETRAYREEVAWAESTRKADAAREAELKAAWCEYHQEQGRRHRAVLEALVAHHESKAAELAQSGGDAA